VRGGKKDSRNLRGSNFTTGEKGILTRIAATGNGVSYGEKDGLTQVGGVDRMEEPLQNIQIKEKNTLGDAWEKKITQQNSFPSVNQGGKGEMPRKKEEKIWGQKRSEERESRSRE